MATPHLLFTGRAAHGFAMCRGMEKSRGRWGVIQVCDGSWLRFLGVGVMLLAGVGLPKGSGRVGVQLGHSLRDHAAHRRNCHRHARQPCASR